MLIIPICVGRTRLSRRLSLNLEKVVGCLSRCRWWEGIGGIGSCAGGGEVGHVWWGIVVWLCLEIL